MSYDEVNESILSPDESLEENSSANDVEDATVEDVEVLEFNDPEVPLSTHPELSEAVQQEMASLEADDFPVENLLVDLEELMVRGKGRCRRRDFCKKKYGVNRDTVERFEKFIRGLWTIEGTSSFVLQRRRDEYREMYRVIYEDAVDPRSKHYDPKLAAKVVDSMAELDGIRLGNVNLVTVGAGVNQGQAQLTNQTRQRTQELLNLMKIRAETHAVNTTSRIQDTRSPAPKEEDPLIVPSSRVMGVVK